MKKIYAYVSEKGIVATMDKGSWYPFVCIDKKAANQLKSAAMQIAKVKGQTIKLMEFKNGKILEELNGMDE